MIDSDVKKLVLRANQGSICQYRIRHGRFYSRVTLGRVLFRAGQGVQRCQHLSEGHLVLGPMKQGKLNKVVKVGSCFVCAHSRASWGLVLVGLLFGRGGGRNCFFATDHTDAHGLKRMHLHDVFSSSYRC